MVPVHGQLPPLKIAALPFYHGIAKCHKTPLAIRYIAASQEVTTTGVNKTLTAFFRALAPRPRRAPEVAGLWRDSVEPIPGFADTP